MTTHNNVSLTGRRVELMAELFLHGLKPRFVAQATMSDFVFDFFLGFSNSQGGINICAVEVKSTERPLKGHYIMRAKQYQILANTNIPVLLLIVDVKENVFYYVWPRDQPDLSQLKESIRIPVTRVDDEARRALIARMTG